MTRPPFIRAKTIGLTATLALSLSLGLSGCSFDSEKNLMQSAQGFMEKRDPKSALIQMRTAIQKYPNSPSVRMAMGNLLLYTGDPVGAALELEKALDLKASPDSVLPLLARALLGSGENRKVINRFSDQRLVTAGAQAELLASIAVAHLQLGQEKAGDEKLEQALATDPESTWALLLKARRVAGKQQFDESLSLLERAKVKHPDPAQIHHLQGEVLLLGKNDRAAAQQAFEEAIRVRADYAPAHASLVGLAISAVDQDLARKRLEAMMKAAPKHPHTTLLEGQFALLEGKLEKAEGHAQQLMKIAPEDLRVLMLSGELAARKGALAQAETYLGRVVQRAPDALPARKLLAQTYLRLGDTKRTLEVLEPAIEAKRADAAAHALVGQAHLQDGNIDKAEIHFRSAVKMAPEDVRIRTANALVQFSKGQTQALAELETLAANDKGTTADFALLTSRMQQGDVDGALRAAKAIERKQPDQPLGPNLEGRVYLQAERMGEAREAFERAVKIDPKHFASVASLATLDVLEKKPQDAVKRLEALAKLDTKNIQPLMTLAELKARTGGTPKEVDELLVRAVKAFPDQSLPRVTLVNHRLVNQDAAGAVNAAQEAFSALPDRPEVMLALGRAQLRAGENQQAATTFRKLVGLEPLNAQFHMALVEAYQALDDRVAVRQTLKRVLEIKPDMVQAQRGLVALALRDGKSDEGLSVAQEMQKQRPKDPTGLLVQGDIEMFRKAWDAAVTAYRNAQRISPSTEGAIKLHTALTSAQRRGEAEAMATQWEKQYPLDSAFRVYLGDVASNSQEWAAAERHYGEANKVVPNNPLILNNLAYAKLMLGRKDALPLAQKANEILPDSSPLMDTLALALAGSGEVGKAVALQLRAVERDGSVNPGLRLTLAKLYLQAGDKSKARQELQVLAGLGERFPEQKRVAELMRQI